LTCGSPARTIPLMNEIEALRAKLKDDIRRLEEALTKVDEVEALARGIAALPSSPKAPPQRKGRPPSGSSPTWPDLVDKVLRASVKPMSATSIAKALVAEGLDYRGKTPLPSMVRSVLHKNQEGRGWEQQAVTGHWLRKDGA